MNPNEINSTRDALLEIAERLRQQATGVGVESNQPANTNGTPATTMVPSSLQSHTVQSRIALSPRVSAPTDGVNEHRRLFGYAARSKPKKGKSVSKQKVQTCSLKFVCLASGNAVKPPTTVKERTILANAGLGDSTVLFDVDGNSSHFHEKILAAFPKLGCAGYELMLYDRTGENPSFCSLKPPYVPRKLKEVAGQCKIYVKPLQRDLIDENEEEETQDVDVVGPIISCIECDAAVPMSTIEEHHHSVHGGQPKCKKKRQEPCIYNMLQQDVGESSRSYEVKDVLQTLVPTASTNEIDYALFNAGGNADVAAQQLLGLHEDPEVIDLEILETSSLRTSSDNTTDSAKPMTLQDFRKNTVDESLCRQKFTVSREDGLEELKKDILGCYKNPQIKLKAKPRVKFEGEEGVGSGPIREFLLCAIKIVEDGFNNGGKPVLFFEGEDDHKLPMHDQAMRCTGAFKAIGRIIGHCILHEGPVVYGLSPAVVQYWRLTAKGTDDDVALENLTFILQDIPDVDLRGYITELENLSLDDAVPTTLRDAIAPYVFESGLDIDMLSSNRKLIVQGVVMYNIIHKRRRELDDIAKGMNEIDFLTFIGDCPLDSLEDIFPNSARRIITADQFKEAVAFEESVGHEDTIMWFYQYLCELEKYEAGKPSMTDLCCFWTAMNNLPPRNSGLLAKFCGGDSLFPFAETCFYSMVLPTVHKSYEEFRKWMDIALNHGSMGIIHS